MKILEETDNYIILEVERSKKEGFQEYALSLKTCSCDWDKDCNCEDCFYKHRIYDCLSVDKIFYEDIDDHCILGVNKNDGDTIFRDLYSDGVPYLKSEEFLEEYGDKWFLEMKRDKF